MNNPDLHLVWTKAANPPSHCGRRSISSHCFRESSGQCGPPLHNPQCGLPIPHLPFKCISFKQSHQNHICLHIRTLCFTMFLGIFVDVLRILKTTLTSKIRKYRSFLMRFFFLQNSKLRFIKELTE